MRCKSPLALLEAAFVLGRSASQHLLPTFVAETTRCAHACYRQAAPACWHATFRAGEGLLDRMDQVSQLFAFLKPVDKYNKSVT